MQPQVRQDEPDFYTRFRGSFSGILKWSQLDELWHVLKATTNTGWYIYAIGEDAPQQPVSAEQLNTFIDEIDLLLRKEHRENYCGVVYVDDKTHPTFVKIYDPNNLGVVCGFSDNPPLPGWILSRIKPEVLDEKHLTSQSRKQWWRRLFSS